MAAIHPLGRYRQCPGSSQTGRGKEEKREEKKLFTCTRLPLEPFKNLRAQLCTGKSYRYEIECLHDLRAQGHAKKGAGGEILCHGQAFARE